ncbi:glycosyltransferase family 4 protein [Paraburkholderia bryophila]|uniref:Alpha-1,3-rhamnosyl/mannosyltransferase n=1 Tax=Paraburkholderia bryophila TaxID=420952 RepID=A0A7Z0BAP9_9BURK|nr:alpha-1,3-rhamnosyl/mannosyltransferase [Paraburkholderia bryophila]
MKLILSVDALAPVLTGIGRYAWELASRVPEVAGVESVRMFRNGRWIANAADLLLPAPTVGRPRPRKTLRSKLKLPGWARELEMKRACRRSAFHGPNYFLPPYAERGVVTVHDLSVFKFPETHPPERIRHFERDFFRSVEQATHLITDSEATRNELIVFLGCASDKVTAVPLGVSRQFAPHDHDKVAAFLRRYDLATGGYALCVSTLEPRKKIESLLRAYRTLPTAVREAYPLILVGGSGWLSESLHQQIERFTNEGWLRYLGFVPEADLHLLYAGARAFLYPSIYEGFGLPVLEAMASGVPVVTSDRTSLPEVTQGAALLIDPDNIDALGEAVEKALCDEIWRNQAKTRGLTVAQRYSWERCIDATVAVYRNIPK